MLTVIRSATYTVYVRVAYTIDSDDESIDISQIFRLSVFSNI